MPISPPASNSSSSSFFFFKLHLFTYEMIRIEDNDPGQPPQGTLKSRAHGSAQKGPPGRRELT